MDLSHGIDMAEVPRIRSLLERHGDRFLNRIFTRTEQSYAKRFRDPAERLAGRFAAKEAVFKLFGTGWSEALNWTDIEVVNNPKGQPAVRLYGHARALAEQLGIRQISISITHTRDFAIASVVASLHHEGQ